MKYTLLLIAIFACTIGLLKAQTVNLDVIMKDKKIGEITASKTTKGKVANATLSSKVNVTMLFQVNVESTIASEYKDGKLVKTDAARVSNIKTENRKSSITWDGKQYNISKDGSEPTTQTGPAAVCVLDLYLKEPVGITQAFSELGGIYMPVTSLGDHRYQLKINDSKTDTWVYGTDGKLIQVESVIAMNQVIFKVR